MAALFILDMENLKDIKIEFVREVPSEEWENITFPTTDLAESYCLDKLSEHGVNSIVSGLEPPF